MKIYIEAEKARMSKRISITKMSHGHFRASTHDDSGWILSAIITDTMLVDGLRSNDDQRIHHAENELIEYILERDL